MLFFEDLLFTDKKNNDATVLGYSGLHTPNDDASFFVANGKTLKKSMVHRGETTWSVMPLFEDLLFTDKKNDVAVLGV